MTTRGGFYLALDDSWFWLWVRHEAHVVGSGVIIEKPILELLNIEVSDATQKKRAFVSALARAVLEPIPSAWGS